MQLNCIIKVIKKFKYWYSFYYIFLLLIILILPFNESDIKLISNFTEIKDNNAYIDTLNRFFEFDKKNLPDTVKLSNIFNYFNLKELKYPKSGYRFQSNKKYYKKRRQLLDTLSQRWFNRKHELIKTYLAYDSIEITNLQSHFDSLCNNQYELFPSKNKSLNAIEIDSEQNYFQFIKENRKQLHKIVELEKSYLGRIPYVDAPIKFVRLIPLLYVINIICMFLLPFLYINFRYKEFSQKKFNRVNSVKNIILNLVPENKYIIKIIQFFTLSTIIFISCLSVILFSYLISGFLNTVISIALILIIFILYISYLFYLSRKYFRFVRI